MALAEDDDPRNRPDDYRPSDGDVRLDFGLDRRAAMFVDWLVVLAPLHARAFARPWSPISRAIFDMRAAALKLDEADTPSNIWILNEPDPAFDDLSRLLWLYGIDLPRSMFDAVWQLYCDFLAGAGQEEHGLRGEIPPDDYEWYLRDVALSSLRHFYRGNTPPRPWTVAEQRYDFSRQRYGCNPR